MRRASLETIMPEVMSEWGGTTYTIYEGGEAQVGVVDDAPIVAKTIRKGHSTVIQWQPWREISILSFLQDTIADCPVQIPYPLVYESEPLYSVMSKLPGKPLDEQIIATLTPPERKDMGRTLGEFMAWHGKALSIETFMEEIGVWHYGIDSFDGNFDNFFGRYVRPFYHSSLPLLSNYAPSYWSKYNDSYPDGTFLRGDRILHFDLKANNLTHLNGKLVGVCDWNGAFVGNINQELRWARHMGADVFDAAVSELARHNIHVDPEQVRLWDTMRWLGVLCCSITEGRLHNPYLPMAAQYLAKNIPEDWSELEAVINRASA